MYRFLGHGPHGGALTYKGKVYHAGDNVPMTKAEVEAMAAVGLSFENIEADPSAAPVESPAEDRAHDDRGAVAPEGPRRRP